jgi:transposase
MLAPPKSRRIDEPIAASLDDLVPAGHFYRHLEPTLDLAFRELVRDSSAGSGRPSINPVVFLKIKLHLILFFEDLRSERQPGRLRRRR